MRRLKFDFHAVGDVGFGVLAINAASFDGVGRTPATGGTTMVEAALLVADRGRVIRHSTMFASTPMARPRRMKTIVR